MGSGTQEFADESYELGIVRGALQRYPELTELVGETVFSPESHASANEQQTFGATLFPDAAPDQLIEFDRTALSLVLLDEVFNGDYDKFTESQAGPNKLPKELFDNIGDFYRTNFDTPEKRDLLEYYIVINDIGKSQKRLAQLEEQGIEVADHDEALTELLKLGTLPTMDTLSEQDRRSLENVLTYGVNVGQLMQGESVDYDFRDLNNLSEFERNLMLGEAIIDIAGVAGATNQRGSVVLNRPTAENFLLAAGAIQRQGGSPEMYDDFLSSKAELLDIAETDHDTRRAITRVCLMARLNTPSDVAVVENYFAQTSGQNDSFIAEMCETGYGDKPAILPYYSPAVISNALGFYKKAGVGNPLEATLAKVIPFLQRSIDETRAIHADQHGNGVLTLQLRDAALATAANPDELDNVVIK